jgi:uncharacterized protein (DUF736 family)
MSDKQYDNTNRGVLFKNERKESDKHPDYKGNLNVEGVEYWLDAWIKEGKSGKFMSVSIKKKEPMQKQVDVKKQQNPMDDDDLPF